MEAAVLGDDFMLYMTQRLWMPIRKGKSLDFWGSRGTRKRSHEFQIFRHDRSYLPDNKSDVRLGQGVDDKLGYH